MNANGEEGSLKSGHESCGKSHAELSISTSPLIFTFDRKASLAGTNKGMNNATKDCEPGSLPVSLPSLTATITKEKLDTNAHSCMKQYNNCKNKKQGQAAREEVADTTQVSVTHDYFNSYQHGLGTSLPPPLPRREITPDSRISMKKNSQNDQYEMSLLSNNNSSLRILPGSINNNNEDLFTKSIEESKYPPFIGDYYKHVLLYDSDSRSEKRERGIKYTDKDYFFPVPFPWKRIAYVGVLLVLGITCLILALMKICGIADWMNSATFAVMVMAAVMLFPPGVYYGSIIICILCQYKDYTMWDVPAGPFG